MDNIRWKVSDPLGNEICLTEETFFNNASQTQIESRIKFAVEHPRFIIKDKSSESRRVYLDLIDVVHEGSIIIRAIEVVVNGGKIISWFVRRATGEVFSESKIIYDSQKMKCRYDTDHDVMYVRLEKYTSEESAYYVDDEVLPDINEVRDERNEDLVGFVILDYRRNKPELVKRYPEYFF